MVKYHEDFVERLHLVWGLGFLSPGGPDEVRDIVRGLALDGARVLDIGCGTGGPAIVLAKETGANLVAIDVEEQLLERATRLARREGVADRIEFRLVEPGPLPFDEASFDVVFSKDSLIHIADKAGLYNGILRVLKPGGRFAASDWLSGENAAEDPAFREYMGAVHLDFTMATAAETVAVMRAAGFADIRTKDRNAWYAEVAAQDLAAIEGPLREQIIAVSSQETYEEWVIIRRQHAAVVRSGSLRPTHLDGTRPQ